MKTKALAIVLLSATAIGAAATALSEPRDLTDVEAKEQAEAAASTTWKTEVGETDQAVADRDAAQAALDAAQATLDAQVIEETDAYAALQTAAAATAAARDAVPKPQG